MAIMIENENTFVKALAEGINLFLGAGFPVLSKDDKERALPLGNQLKLELIDHFNLTGSEDLNLSQICTVLESDRRDGLYAFLKNRFAVKTFDSRYGCLDSINTRSIFTTNIDDLIFRIYANSLKHYINDIAISGPAFKDRDAVDFLALHGCVIHNNDEFLFNPLDLASAFSSDPDKWRYLTHSIQKLPTLFWGYGLWDAGVLQALSPKTTGGRAHKDKWIVLQRSDDPATKYFQALGFKIIVSDTARMLDYLKNNQPKADGALAYARRATKDIFPNEAIPDPTLVPVRPIIQFYVGAQPSWYDIFTGNIYRTSHYSRIIDSINSGKSTLVLGVPASGKTTLLMQIAAEISFGGHKLVCELLTPEKAHMIVKKLDGERALMFVDEFCSDIDAFNLLARTSNVSVIGFDRDYNFEISSHKVDRSLCNIIDVTDLDDKDIQEIFAKIPIGIRKPSYALPKTAAGIPPALFEVIEENTSRPGLKARFASVLHQLNSQDQVLHDLFVMCCYVHSCGTPVSLDMAYAFLNEIISDYADVYAMFDRLGSLLTDYYGNIIDTDDQDYFVPRSHLVSEAVLDQVSQPALRRVLLRFHSQVSSFRICRFDVFRRRAFDANLMKKTFENWKEGKEFYELAYGRDKSPYLLQQGALYLAHKKQFQEAFSMIDQAVLQSHYKIPSIRNSHAIILFKANIGSPIKDEVVQHTLSDSMDILKDCYKNDRRKTYHATTFADQAVQYWEVYPGERAKGYLLTAEQWLLDEAKNSPWHRYVNYQLRQVQTLLRQIGR